MFGTTGWIDVLPRFHHPATIVLHRAGAEPETITRRPAGVGYSHELVEVVECLRAGRTESAVMPLADTLAVPPTAYAHLMSTILPDSGGMTLLAWIKQNNVLTTETQQALTILPIAELATAGAGSVGRAALISDSASRPVMPGMFSSRNTRS